MAQGGIPRMFQPPTGSTNAGAGPVPIGATVPGPNSGGGAQSWHPTVVNLLVLLVVELAAFAALRMLFRKM